jgi:transcriptional regulator with XRE-family HTH domain
MLTDDEFRAKLRDVLARSGLSMRALSAALGRDPGYVAALLDPSRPSRARPTPADLVRASDATGIPFVELLESLWGIEPSSSRTSSGDSGWAPRQIIASPRSPISSARRSATSSTSSPHATPGTLGAGLAPEVSGCEVEVGIYPHFVIAAIVSLSLR